MHPPICCSSLIFCEKPIISQIFVLMKMQKNRRRHCYFKAFFILICRSLKIGNTSSLECSTGIDQALIWVTKECTEVVRLESQRWSFCIISLHNLCSLSKLISENFVNYKCLIFSTFFDICVILIIRLFYFHRIVRMGLSVRFYSGLNGRAQKCQEKRPISNDPN